MKKSLKMDDVIVLQLLHHLRKNFGSYKSFTAKEANEVFRKLHPISTSVVESMWRTLLPDSHEGSPECERVLDFLVRELYIDDLGTTRFTDRALKTSERQYRLSALGMSPITSRKKR